MKIRHSSRTPKREPRRHEVWLTRDHVSASTEVWRLVLWDACIFVYFYANLKEVTTGLIGLSSDEREMGVSVQVLIQIFRGHPNFL